MFHSSCALPNGRGQCQIATIGRSGEALDLFIPDLFITAAVRMDAMDKGAIERALDIANVGRRKTRAVGIERQHARRRTAVKSRQPNTASAVVAEDGKAISWPLGDNEISIIEIPGTRARVAPLVFVVMGPSWSGAVRVRSIDPANREFPAPPRAAAERAPRLQTVRTACVRVRCRQA